MSASSSSTLIVIIIAVAAVAIIGFLVYSQSQSSKAGLAVVQQHPIEHMTQQYPAGHAMNINIDTANDPYSDAIKKQDYYAMNDPLTYPQLRLPREVLEKYQEYQERTGEPINFYQYHKPLFDNPILNGYMIKQSDANDPFTDTSPVTLPLFRMKNPKNTNRFFYYTIDQRNPTDLKLKIPLDGVKVNGKKYENSEFYGLPELYDGDIIEDIVIFPNTKFSLMLYKTHTHP